MKLYYLIAKELWKRHGDRVLWHIRNNLIIVSVVVAMAATWNVLGD